MKIDKSGRRWYKGNLHTHTTRSDGRLIPEAVVSLYREKGYDFLALTDHWSLSRTEEREDILLLSGCEYDVGATVQEGIYHIVGIGMESPPALRRSPSLTAQKIIDGIRAVGGIAILAHPAWSLNRPEEAAKLTDLAGTEIYNSVSGLPWNVRPYSGAFVDQMASRGVFLNCMAADDAHFYQGDETLSYLMVRAEEHSPAALLDALRRGDFYATQGPEFSLRQEGIRILVDCTPVKSVAFFTDTVWAGDRATCGEAVTHAEYRIKPTDTFVRVELTDSQGKQAWSSCLRV